MARSTARPTPGNRALLAIVGIATLSLAAAAVRGGAAAPARINGLGDSARPVGQIGGVSRAFAVQGSVLWSGLGPRVAAIDARDAAQLHVIGRTTWLESEVMGLAVDGDLAVAVTSGGRLHVVDIADPTAPRAIGEVALPSPPASVAFTRGVAYVVHQARSDPRQELGPGANVAVVDVHDPQAPRLVRAALLPANSGATDLVVAGGLLAVASGPRVDDAPADRELRLFRLDEPTAPKLVATHVDRAWLRLASALDASGRPLVYGYGWGGIAVDFASPARPRLVARYGDPEGDGSYWWSARIAASTDGRLFFTSHTGMATVVGELARQPLPPEAPVWTGWSAGPGGRTAGGFALVGAAVIVATTGGPIEVFDTKALGEWRGSFANLDLPGTIDTVAVSSDGAALLATAYQGGLWVLDLTADPVEARIQGFAWDEAYHTGLTTASDLAVVGFGGSGDALIEACYVYQLDRRLPPRRMASWNFGCGYEKGMVLAANRLYSGPPSGEIRHGIRVHDLADPAKPIELEPGRLAGPVTDVAVDATRLAAPHFSGGSSLWDAVLPLRVALFDLEPGGLSAPLGDWAVDVPVEAPWYPPRLALDGDHGYLVAAAGRGPDRAAFLSVLDLSDPARPVTDSTLRLPAQPGDVEVHGGYAFANTAAGTLIIDVRTPTAPQEVGLLDVPVSTVHDGVAVRDGLVYVAAWSHGIYVFRPDLAWTTVPDRPTPTATVAASPATPWPTLTPWPTVTPVPAPNLYLPVAMAPDRA